MKFLVDESTGKSVAELLRNLGHDTVGVWQVMPQADDEDILAKAVTEERIVVTNDKDFGTLVFRSGKPHAGIILLRLQDESAANRVAVMERVLKDHADQLAGSIVVATEQTIRIRPAE